MQIFTFIGLGNMGFQMVQHLIRRKNTHVNIFDINKKIYKKFTQKNITKLNSIEDLPKETTVFFTMLPDGKSLEKVVLGKNGVAKIAKKGTHLIDFSSIDYSITKKINTHLLKRGVGLLDAPVSGGVSGAKNKSLTIMVGGDKKIFNKSKKILSLFGKNIFFVGKSGSGQIIKTCNNMMLGINMIGICESYLLSKRYGIDKKLFFKICSTSSSSSWAMLNHLPIKGLTKNSAANNGFKPGYAAKLITKDLNIAQSLAKNANMDNILGKNAKSIYDKFCNDGFENLDYAGIIKYLEKN